MLHPFVADFSIWVGALWVFHRVLILLASEELLIRLTRYQGRASFLLILLGYRLILLKFLLNLKHALLQLVLSLLKGDFGQLCPISIIIVVCIVQAVERSDSRKSLVSFQWQAFWNKFIDCLFILLICYDNCFPQFLIIYLFFDFKIGARFLFWFLVGVFMHFWFSLWW